MTIHPSESFDVFLYFESNSEEINSFKIYESKFMKLTLIDVKNKRYSKKIQLK
jgi:hypothetical protein